MEVTAEIEKAQSNDTADQEAPKGQYASNWQEFMEMMNKYGK